MSRIVEFLVTVALLILHFFGWRYILRQKRKDDSPERKNVVILKDDAAERKRNVILVQVALVIVTFGWLFFSRYSSAERSAAERAVVWRDLWQSAKSLPIGYDITSQCLDLLKGDLARDPAGMREALGEAELHLLQERIQTNDEVLAKRKELLANIDAKKKEIDQLKSTIDSKRAEFSKITALVDRYKDDLEKAAAAEKEKRRIAPAGDYTLKIDYDLKPDSNLELALLVGLTQAECLAENNETNTGSHYTRHFDGVTKEYADKRGEQCRAAGATATVEKTTK